MLRHRCVMLVCCAVFAAISAPGAIADPKGPPTCPPGYDLSPMTLDQALVLYAGYFTEEEIRAGFAGHDANGNGIVCRKHPPAFDLERFLPLNLLIDDLAERPKRA
jgi:hypothetical protein